MTSRRALLNGTRAARLLAMVAALRSNGWSAALVLAGSFLLPACPALAATRVNHPHHAPPPSAGRAQAHVVHAEDLGSSRSSSKLTSRKDHHAAEPTRAEATERGSRATHSSTARKGADTSHRPSDNETARRASKASAKAKKSQKHHEEAPIDDPMPLRRASAGHGKHELLRESQHEKEREAYSEASSHKPVYSTARPNEPSYSLRRSAASRVEENYSAADNPADTPVSNALPALPVHNGTPGNVARNLARHAGQSHTTLSSPSAPANPEPPRENLTGVSQPDDDEKLPLRSGNQRSSGQPPTPSASTRRQPVVATVTAASLISAASESSAASTTAAVEGFGGEVDFHSTGSEIAKHNALTPVAPPRGTPAEQALSLREAAEVASKPMFVPLYNRDGKLVVPPPLKGTRDILVHQNQMADDAGLTRIQDDADLNRLRRAHLLVDLEETASLRVNEALPENRRAARPWAVKFANDIADAFYSRFGQALQVNSAVRTVSYQLRLQRVNGNAAAVEGEGASPHLTGQAIDFGKRGMSMAQIAWMRSYLMPLIDAGKIDVEEEFQQACFHISVYASYTPAPHHHASARTELAQVPRVHGSQPASATEANDNLQ